MDIGRDVVREALDPSRHTRAGAVSNPEGPGLSSSRLRNATVGLAMMSLLEVKDEGAHQPWINRAMSAAASTSRGPGRDV